MRPSSTPAAISPTTTGTASRVALASSGPTRPQATISVRIPNVTGTLNQMTEIATPPGIDIVKQAKIDLAACFRAAALYGFNEGIDNHFSLAVPGRDDLFLLNRYGPHWSELCASDILTVDLDGNVVEGSGEWDATAFMIHRGAHRARADARCVLHTHMPYATALSLTDDGFITEVSQNSMYFHGHTARLDYGGFATAERGDAHRRGDRRRRERRHAREPRGAGGRHGRGRRVAQAVLPGAGRQVQVLAQSTGRPSIRVTDERGHADRLQWERDAGAAPSLFAAMKRRLDRENPGYQL